MAFQSQKRTKTKNPKTLEPTAPTSRTIQWPFKANQYKKMQKQKPPKHKSRQQPPDPEQFNGLSKPISPKKLQKQEPPKHKSRQQPPDPRTLPNCRTPDRGVTSNASSSASIPLA
jgi:hypothetical protein